MRLSSDFKACFTCVHSHIYETSHEWLECKCEFNPKWHNPYECCGNYASAETHDFDTYNDAVKCGGQCKEGRTDDV